MSVFIKICGLRDAECVAAAVEAGSDAVGFVFADSPRKVSPAEANAISQDIPAGVRRVAVMHHPSNDEWQSVLKEFTPDVLQSDIGDFDVLDVPDNITRWPVIRQGSGADVAVPRQVFVYEGTDSGTGETVDWMRAAEIGKRGQMILAGGLAAANVATAIKTAQPWGVDVSSGVESSRGQKGVELIRQFVVAARAAEND
jgi:phosphoribosylanthranilate isomerase